MDIKEQIDEVCDANGISEPLSFLASLMAGKDPRSKSEIWDLIQVIEDENFGDAPSDEQWSEVVKIVEKEYEQEPVDLMTSQKAANTLAEYRHSKRKSIELTTGGGNIEVPELTDKEFDMFEEWFNDQF